MSFNGKRDRTQIIADILNSCKSPKTQTYIRRQTNISYDVLQSSVMQLLLRQWLTQSEGSDGYKKLVTSEKGLVFLDKWVELQKMVGVKSKRKMGFHEHKIQHLIAK